MLSYLVFGVAYAFRFKKSIKGRALVVMGALPLSIVGGVLRLSVIFASGYYIGPIMVEHNPHVVLSWTVFMVLPAAVILLDQYLSKRHVSLTESAENTEKDNIFVPTSSGKKKT